MEAKHGENEGKIQMEKPSETPDEHIMRKWVQYYASVFAQVSASPDGSSATVTRVILATEAADIRLARDENGRPMIYNFDFTPAGNSEPASRVEDFDIVSVAENRFRWPEGRLVALSRSWDVGPDPRLDPEYYS